MKVLIYSIIVLFVFSLLIGWGRERYLKNKLKRGEIKKMPGIKKPRPDGCCGQHEVCERESLLAGVSKDIEYYEDEELDKYKGRESDDYTDEEVEAFEDVLTTMREDEVAGWVRSLQLRGINLPDALKDEVFMIVGEMRQ